MNKKTLPFAHIIILCAIVFTGSQTTFAAGDLPTVQSSRLPAPGSIPTPTPRVSTVPEAPKIDAKAYILVDSESGKVLAENASTEHLQPASLTKIMSMYIVSDALRQGRVKLTDKVRVSENAWRTGGSRMFVKVGDEVPLEDLIKGVIVQSGNDACVAVAEHIAGSENSFADLMNQTAHVLGMKDSHFTDSTGMPDVNHYTTARDMAILARALVNNFPDHYEWYKIKWFTYNGIRQPNRNRLLWRDNFVDGIKTGHTAPAGFCLVASAKREAMRLIAVVLGAPNDEARASATQTLLNYGFQFFESHKLYQGGKVLENPRVWLGSKPTVSVGLGEDLIVTIPKGQYKNLEAVIEVQKGLQAPIKKGQILGELQLKLNKEVIQSKSIVALEDNIQGSWWSRTKDHVRMMFNRWFGVSEA